MPTSEIRLHDLLPPPPYQDQRQCPPHGIVSHCSLWISLAVVIALVSLGFTPRQFCMIDSDRPTTTIIEMQGRPLSAHSAQTMERRWPFFDAITGLTIQIPQSKARPFIATASAATPIDNGAGERVRPRARAHNEPSPSRWRTKEFYCYYTVVGIAVPAMAKVVIDLSRGASFDPGMLSRSRTNPTGTRFASKLSSFLPSIVEGMAVWLASRA